MGADWASASLAMAGGGFLVGLGAEDGVVEAPFWRGLDAEARAGEGGAASLGVGGFLELDGGGDLAGGGLVVGFVTGFLVRDSEGCVLVLERGLLAVCLERDRERERER